jgi:hypothetical protein
MARLRLSTIIDITTQLDKMAEEIQAQDPVIALALDQVSDKLERTTQPTSVDPKNLTLKDLKKLQVKVNIKAYDVSQDRVVMAMLVEAGLKEEFMNLFEKGKSSWLRAWGDVKDKATQIAIKGLNTIDKIKDFIAKHPNLKWAVLAAIILGVLVFPASAHAEIMDTTSLQNMAKDMHWEFLQSAGATKMTVGVPKEWVSELVLKSIGDHGLADASAAISDVVHNIKNVIDMKAKMTGITDPEMLSQLKDESASLILKSISPILSKFGLSI